MNPQTHNTHTKITERREKKDNKHLQTETKITERRRKKETEKTRSREKILYFLSTFKAPIWILGKPFEILVFRFGFRGF
jgi:hypothetical protein